MGDLLAQSAFDGGLPLHIGSVVLEECDLGVLTLLSPLGDPSALQGVLDTAHGLSLPERNRMVSKDGARCIWFGYKDVLLVGPRPDAALRDHGSVVDVSDGWAAVTLEGAGAVEVLARLVPIDLRAGAFGLDATARTMVGHMTASISCVGADRFVILVFRSMAGTLVHELQGAMEGVASRG